MDYRNLFHVYADWECFSGALTIASSCKVSGTLIPLDVPEEVLPSLAIVFELGEASAINGGL